MSHAELAEMEDSMSEGRIEGVASHATQQVVALYHEPHEFAADEPAAFPINRAWRALGLAHEPCLSLRAPQVFLVRASIIDDSEPYRSLTFQQLLAFGMHR